MSEEEIKPQIIVTFREEGSAIFSLEFTGNISPSQLLTVASMLEFEAKYMLSTYKNQQEYIKAQQEQAKQQIVTPTRSKIAIPEMNFDDRDLST